MRIQVGAINIKYENIEFENGNIEIQSGEPKVKFRQKGHLSPSLALPGGLMPKFSSHFQLRHITGYSQLCV